MSGNEVETMQIVIDHPELIAQLERMKDENQIATALGDGAISGEQFSRLWDLAQSKPTVTERISDTIKYVLNRARFPFSDDDSELD